MRQRAGFTLIEVLIALAIFGFLMVFGVIAGIDTLSRYNFHAEIDNAAALLQKARSEAINNIGGAAHGVRFDDASYIISFIGAYSPPAYEYKIAKNFTATYTGTAEINFDQLSGRVPACATPCTVTVSDGVRNNIITINYEGGIDY
ncbi:MAG: hypothetical protein A3D64_02835 [Candidatus Wildermuthbacteria bacterium RIFCSPHIGHO2_02_FULL_49_9]|uniref:General secretion pathway GspH domain-containing protein n=1 Tax=Candidatus Wildermuthbacteria bacterium RIFCSPHIGHO2_02_FULL_49_9 TaxID=1802456 RepID=A0A1G2RD28_9BACT|nr:MAG: hypothetical protein A3D64_02835 [Candidatus Wildermuthbacteria bacterium RIFCSPHIGHO2_02_FULL_49_9]